MPTRDKNNINKPNINYLNKDFVSLKKDLINYSKTYFPDTFNDFNESLKVIESNSITINKL